MVENGFVTREDGEKAKAEPLGVTQRQVGAQVFGSEFYAEEVRRNLMDLFGEDKLYGGGLSVRTPLDPTLQRIARKTFVDGMTAYDHRHGWRGIVKNIDVTGDWGKALTAFKVGEDIDPWQLAVVLEVSKDKAVIGLAPEAHVHRGLREGRRAEARSRSARCNGRDRQAEGRHRRLPPHAGRMSSSAATSSMCLPREPKDAQGNNTEGQWSLQQVPAVGGGMAVMDPHTGRATPRLSVALASREASSTAQFKHSASQARPSSR